MSWLQHSRRIGAIMTAWYPGQVHPLILPDTIFTMLRCQRPDVDLVKHVDCWMCLGCSTAGALGPS